MDFELALATTENMNVPGQLLDGLLCKI